MVGGFGLIGCADGAMGGTTFETEGTVVDGAKAAGRAGTGVAATIGAGPLVTGVATVDGIEPKIGAGVVTSIVGFSPLPMAGSNFVLVMFDDNGEVMIGTLGRIGPPLTPLTIGTCRLPVIGATVAVGFVADPIIGAGNGVAIAPDRTGTNGDGAMAARGCNGLMIGSDFSWLKYATGWTSIGAAVPGADCGTSRVLAGARRSNDSKVGWSD